MHFTKGIRGFAVFLSCLIMCGTLHAATTFQVTPTSLTFGDVNVGESKTQIFKVINLQSTPLDVTISHVTGFITITPAGQSPSTCGGCQIPVTLAPNEIKQVQVTFPGTARCLQLNQPITVKSGTEQESISLSAKLVCPELQFVANALTLSLENNQIKTGFSVINTGTIPSNACAGQILLDGSVVQSFNIPAFTTTVPTNQQGFQFFIPAGGGTHSVEIRLDTNSLNREALENDNSKSGTITVPPTPLSITVNKSGAGTGTVTDNQGMNCGTDCSSSVSAGTSVTLKASPSANSVFKNWSGGTGSATGCNNSTSKLCIFTANQNSTITATFDVAPAPPPPTTVTISVSKSGSGTGVVTGEGINCGSDCGQTVNQGSNVALRAEPSANSIFRKWSGGTGSATVCNDSPRPICGFTASQSSRITAVFELTP